MGLKKSEKLVLYLTQVYNAVLTEGTVPKGWKKSKTVMIPKMGKPTAKDHSNHRPIALTIVGYKIFMGLVKSKLVEHLERNRLISDYQAGFTGCRWLEENLSHRLPACQGADSEHFLSPLISLFTSYLRLKCLRPIHNAFSSVNNVASLVLKLSVPRSRRRLVTQSSTNK